MQGFPLGHITFTSDRNGSLPNFDKQGRLVSIDMGLPKSIFTQLVDTVVLEKFPFEKALKVVSSNVAGILKLKNKGRLKAGKDADLVILDKDFRISEVIARGQIIDT